MRDAALAHSVLVEPGSAFGISSREPHSCSASILGTHPVGVSAGDDDDGGWEDIFCSCRDACLSVRFHRAWPRLYTRSWLLTHYFVVMWALHRNDYVSGLPVPFTSPSYAIALSPSGSDPALWWRARARLGGLLWGEEGDAGRQPVWFWRRGGWLRVRPAGWVARRRTRRYRGLLCLLSRLRRLGRADRHAEWADRAVEEALTARELLDEGAAALFAPEEAEFGAGAF